MELIRAVLAYGLFGFAIAGSAVLVGGIIALVVAGPGSTEP